MRILFVLAITVLASCSQSGSAIGKQLAGSDSLVINFNVPQSTNIQSTLTTTEKKAIKKLAQYIDNKTSQAYKCGYDGNLLFYKDGTLTGDVSFNYAGDGCHHFIMLLNGELTPTTMSNEAADFLKSLAQGKSWY